MYHLLKILSPARSYAREGSSAEVRARARFSPSSRFVKLDQGFNSACTGLGNDHKQQLHLSSTYCRLHQRPSRPLSPRRRGSTKPSSSLSRRWRPPLRPTGPPIGGLHLVRLVTVEVSSSLLKHPPSSTSELTSSHLSAQKSPATLERPAVLAKSTPSPSRRTPCP